MPHRVIAVAESDSYLKWAVSLLAQLPGGAVPEIVVACSPIRPSAAQRIAATAGTAFAAHEPQVLSPSQLARRVDQSRPDAVLLACTGPSAHAYQEALSRCLHRPVLLAGIPGIALPARRRAWRYRGAVDLFVVHSHREVEEYEQVRELAGKTGKIGLATIPFLDRVRDPAVADVTGNHPVERAGRPANRVLFATQAKVPKLARERIEILRALADLATSRPELDVVVKTRGLSGEFHTHHEAHHYADLWTELLASGAVRDPSLLSFASGSMAEHLRRAAALITVSSTAALEAMALDVPVLVIDEFGVSHGMLNEVFVGSGCLQGLGAVRDAQFRRPEPAWLAANYFHPDADNTWIGLLDELVGRAAAGQLPPVAAGLDPGRSTRRRRRDRLRLTPAGSALVRARQRLRTRLRAGDRSRPDAPVESS